jgi:hypothetical protein
MQLYCYFVSQPSEFCRHNPLCCFSTSVYCCERIFRYRLSPETFRCTLVYAIGPPSQSFQTSPQSAHSAWLKITKNIFVLIETNCNRLSSLDLLTNFMQQSHCEADSHSFGQEIPRLLWNTEIPLPWSHEPATGPDFESHKSNPNPVCLKWIVLVFSHLHLNGRGLIPGCDHHVRTGSWK